MNERINLLLHFERSFASSTRTTPEAWSAAIEPDLSIQQQSSKPSSGVSIQEYLTMIIIITSVILLDTCFDYAWNPRITELAIDSMTPTPSSAKRTLLWVVLVNL